ncbi:MAG: TAXI family TRAP transporter solute-binding subunit [Halioglobus sp.]
MHIPRDGAVDEKVLRPIFEQQSRIAFTLADPKTNQSGLQALVSGDADLALVENSSPFQPGVRVILPGFESVLHILLRDGVVLEESDKPFKNKSIYISNDSHAGEAFVKMAAARQRLAPDEINIVKELVAGQTDIVVYFGPVSPRHPLWYIPGYRLHSLDPQNLDTAMSSQGLSYALPYIESTVIPAFTYDIPGNEQIIYTLSVDTLLATRKEIPERTIYRLTRTLLQDKPRFAAVAPEIFSGINEDFDPLELSFPMHSGSRRYIDRDEPTGLERYAETINMLAYVFFGLLTAGVYLARLAIQKKKDRIDEFYFKVMQIRQRAKHEPSQRLIEELQQLEREAFESLIAEKLAADESFRIFIELLTRALTELKSEADAQAIG